MGRAGSKHQNSNAIKCITIFVEKPILPSMATERQMTMETERAVGDGGVEMRARKGEGWGRL